MDVMLNSQILGATDRIIVALTWALSLLFNQIDKLNKEQEDS